MDKRPNENEEQIVAKNEPIIDGISSGTTYYNSSNKKGDRIFMIGLLIASGIFIFFLPNIYNFAHEHSIVNLLEKTEKTPGGTETPTEPEEEPTKPEVTYDAKVCTKATSDDVVTAHTLYFSDGQLKKVSLAETYTLGENYNSSELDEYYQGKKDIFGSYDSISIDTTIDDKTYSATALLDLEKTPTNASELMTVKLEYNQKDKDVIKAYTADGFDCE